MDLSFITAFGGTGIAGLVVIAIVAVVFIMARYGLPYLRDLKDIVTSGHAENREALEIIGGKVDTLIKSDGDQEKRLRSIEMTQMKKDVYNQSIPYAERVWSAHKYIRLGGNGGVKDYICGEFRDHDPVTFDSVWNITEARNEDRKQF